MRYYHATLLSCVLLLKGWQSGLGLTRRASAPVGGRPSPLASVKEMKSGSTATTAAANSRGFGHSSSTVSGSNNGFRGVGGIDQRRVTLQSMHTGSDRDRSFSAGISARGKASLLVLACACLLC
jgi:hypothetical protein